MSKMLAENITERERYARGRAVLVLQEPGRVAWFQGEIQHIFQGENGEECVVELKLAEKYDCNYLLMAMGKNSFSKGEYSR